ncbi:hypothetical protein ACHAWT_006816 [Skeletonema menzelii]|eukprot:scaffold26730_cov162-Skeletonema_menzelii.AAC.3
MMPSSKEATVDLTRIALFGVALEVSRFIAKEVLSVIGSRNNAEKSSIETIHNNDFPLICSAITGTKQMLRRLMSRRTYTLLGLTATPPLLLYGVWNYQLNRSTGSNRGATSPLVFCGMYASSVMTSFCLMLWVYPSLLSNRCGSNTDYDDLEEENDIIHESDDQYKASEDNVEEVKTASAKEDKPSSENILLSPPRPPQPSNTNVVLSSPLSVHSRPPLPSSAEERRRRSDSLQSMVSECSVEMQPTTSLVADESRRKFLEILVHNVSHTDLILGLTSVENKRMSSLINPLLDLKKEESTNASGVENGRKVSASNSEERDNRDEKYILSRPRFSAFDMFSKRIVGALHHLSIPTNNESTDSRYHPLHRNIINYPRYERSNACARYTLVTPRPSDQYMLPVGFNLEHCHGESKEAEEVPDSLILDKNEDLPSIRLRGRDISRVDPSMLGETPRRTTSIPSQQLTSFLTPSRNPIENDLQIGAVFFPLLSTLLPRWLGQIADKFGDDRKAPSSNVAAPLYTPNVKKVIVLVSGVGTPRNWTHSINGNSTRACAELMELFINTLYPDVTVVKIHSDTNIFRWEENITFATQELMPCIDSYRDAHARNEPYPDEIASMNGHSGMERNEFNPDWKQSVSVTYSFADGSAARSFAIQSALRPYRPTYFHFWQLKTFWHESKITDEDIEVHSFEEMETVPPMAINQTSGEVSKLVAEMIQFRKDFLETVQSGSRSDLKKFWLRKTKKPVLAVLLVRKPDGTDILYRGTNMEVSMPTGSLCAERNVIGTALAQNPGLKREDLLMVAVLAVTLPEEPSKLQSPPPGGSSFCQPVSPPEKDGVDFVLEVEQKLKQHQSTDGGMRRVRSSSSFASIAEENTKSDEWEMDILQPDSATGKEAITSEKDVPLFPDLHISHLPSPSRPRSNSIPLSGSSTPKRRITLYGKSSSRKTKSSVKVVGGVKKQKETLVLQSLEDLNPLKPCGACNEWLKKIAESNPHFKVLTFTDTHCNGVYVSPCQD